ncbi:hypothetical protein MJK72_05170 [Klebsiella pneumoniae]|nr:hypothetical protein MJK72_05170 [Klebsiella pneumoniae]
MPSICRWIQLATRINTNPRMRFIYLARQVNPDMADYIKKLKLPGIHLREEESRPVLPFQGSNRSPHRLYQRR